MLLPVSFCLPEDWLILDLNELKNGREDLGNRKLLVNGKSGVAVQHGGLTETHEPIKEYICIVIVTMHQLGYTKLDWRHII